MKKIIDSQHKFHNYKTQYDYALLSTDALRGMVENFFNQFKYYWESNGVEWDYNIHDWEDEKGGQVKIRAGANGTTYAVLFNVEFQKPDGKAQAYLRIIGDLGAAGCAKVWQDTVASYRNKNMQLYGVTDDRVKQYPLTTSEAKPGK